MIQVWKIDNNGFLIESRLIKENEKTDRDVTTGFSIGFVKPRWNGSTWVEGATEEEIQAWEEENTTTEKEPPEQEKLNAQLLKSNLEFQKALTEQKKVNANLLLQIQSLQKEGNN